MPNSKHSDLLLHLSEPAHPAAPATPMQVSPRLLRTDPFRPVLRPTVDTPAAAQLLRPSLPSAFWLNLTKPAFRHASCAFVSSASWMALLASSSDLGRNRGVGFGGTVVVKK